MRITRLKPIWAFNRSFSDMTHRVIIRGGGIQSNPPYVQQVTIPVNNYQLLSDEHSLTQQQGGSPYDYLCIALGSCTSITLQMYARRKNILLENLEIILTHKKIKKDEISNLNEIIKNNKNSHVDYIERIIQLNGNNLKNEEKDRMLQIANMCPVHKTLESSCIIVTSLAK